MEKSVDDMKLEIAIMVEEESMLKATGLAREYFPFQACNLKQAVIVVAGIYEEVNGKPYPKRDLFKI
jgi:hypothetical protein